MAVSSVTRLGVLAIAWTSFAIAQVHPDPTGGMFRVSVVANVSSGCGSVGWGTELRQGMEGRLRSAGLPVSPLHTAELAGSLDCTETKVRGSLAVLQCVDYSRLVSLPAPLHGQVLANTWRQCESYTCASKSCGETAQAEMQTLTDAFLAFLREKPATASIPNSARSALISHASDRTHFLQQARTVVFMSYIVVCLAVLVSWQCRKQYY